MITLGSLFDGIGGFPEAARRVGIKTLWASEIEPFCIKVTKIRFPDMEHYGDITKINGAELEPVDIITGGSPCQDLSIAGKRAGLAGERSGLFMEMIRVIRELREHEKQNGRTGINIRPRFMVWENVPGAFSSNKGEDFRAVLEETARIADKTVVIPKPPKGKWTTSGAIMGDSWSIAWRVLDAQYWGVPQRRRRIFLVADFGGQSAPEALFKREGLRRHLEKGREAREGTTTNAERGVDGAKQYLFENHSQDTRYVGPLEVSPIVSATFGMGGNNQPFVVNIPTHNMVAGTVSSKWAKGTGGPAGDECQNLVTTIDCRNLYENYDKSATLQSKSNGGQSLNYQNPIRIGYAVRRLTPLECERLQNFPDGWTDIPGASDSARYKALGNSIAVCCAEYVLEGIKSVF